MTGTPTGTGSTALRFGLATLATWRVTHLLASENGPGDVVVRLRQKLGSGPLGELMDCFQCLSLWVAAPMTPYVVRRRADAVLVWLALSGAACVIERFAGTQDQFLSVDVGNGKETDAVLWPTPRGGGSQPAPLESTR